MKDKILKYRNLIDILVIILVACILGIPLLNSKLNVYYDDGIQHIARALGTKEAFKENALFPNVISSFSNGYGYSWNLFYGPLSVYGICLINVIINDLLISYKIFVFLCMFLSGIYMYKFVKEISGNNDVGILAGILYMTFPYHLTDLYTRNALGEYVSFLFIPLVFLGLYRLFYSEKKTYLLAVGAIGLILTHNLSTIIVAFFSLIYVIFNLEKLTDKKILKKILINIVFIMLITSFYWIPMIEAIVSCNYQVYEDGMMSTSESTARHGLALKQLFITMNDGSYVFELGPHIIIMLALSIMTFRLIRPQFKQQYVLFFICGLLSLWMSTKYFPWKYLPEEFSIIQFPWRMLMMAAFFLSVVCAINMYAIIKKFNFKDVIVISTISILYILAFANVLIVYDEEPLTNIANLNLGKYSGKEYEVVAGCGKGEYLPVNAYKNRFYVATREQGMYVLEGKAIIENQNKNGSNYKASVKTLDAEYTLFELPYVYYPGYEITLDSLKLQNYETENGFLGFVLGKEESGEIEVRYKGTVTMKVSMFISIMSLSVAIGILNIDKVKLKKKFSKGLKENKEKIKNEKANK
ncbi:MAG: hypothetical protein IKL55_02670 [Clostridia bacterium]|nr:hypothetical protein [Clostridia bacterium]